jgi:hypothetical protein
MSGTYCNRAESSFRQDAETSRLKACAPQALSRRACTQKGGASLRRL